jgi:hypothetical protein
MSDLISVMRTKAVPIALGPFFSFWMLALLAVDGWEKISTPPMRALRPL